MIVMKEGGQLFILLCFKCAYFLFILIACFFPLLDIYCFNKDIHMARKKERQHEKTN